jgi:hypothetical protein
MIRGIAPWQSDLIEIAADPPGPVGRSCAERTQFSGREGWSMRRTNPMPRVDSSRRTNPSRVARLTERTQSAAEGRRAERTQARRPRMRRAKPPSALRALWSGFVTHRRTAGEGWRGSDAERRGILPRRTNPIRRGSGRAPAPNEANSGCAERTQSAGVAAPSEANSGVESGSPSRGGRRPLLGKGRRGARGLRVGPGGDRHALRAHGASSWARGPGRCAGHGPGGRACWPAPDGPARRERGPGSGNGRHARGSGGRAIRPDRRREPRNGRRVGRASG